MYKSFYFKPKKYADNYILFVEDFKKDFELNTIKTEIDLMILENNKMLVTLKPKMIEVLVYDYSDREYVKDLRNYLN